jgi:hypothetical protein
MMVARAGSTSAVERTARLRRSLATVSRRRCASSSKLVNASMSSPALRLSPCLLDVEHLDFERLNRIEQLV